MKFESWMVSKDTLRTGCAISEWKRGTKKLHKRKLYLSLRRGRRRLWQMHVIQLNSDSQK